MLANITRLLAENGISIEAVIQKGSVSDGTAEVVILTHRVQEQAIDRAISGIEALESITGKVVRLRMEELND
ncbi:ACT domain-containing protein [Chromobacterium haemolyticum]|nr:ACT domain-containing protein [Chromobacterium haemolyticum]